MFVVALIFVNDDGNFVGDDLVCVNAYGIATLNRLIDGFVPIDGFVDVTVGVALPLGARGVRINDLSLCFDV